MPNSTEDEIDLRFVFKRIGSAFNKLSLLIDRAARFFWKRKVYFSIWLFLGFSLATGYYYYEKPQYPSWMIVRSSLLSNGFCADMLETVQELIEEENYEELGRKLGLSDSTVKCINYISYQNFIPKYGDYYEELEDDSLVRSGPFKIEVWVSDNRILDSLQYGLVQFLENNPYAKKRKMLKIRSLNNLAGKIETQISELDSLKVTIEENMVQKGGGEGITFMQQPIDPINTYREVIDLYQQNQKMREQIDLASGIEVVDGFTRFSKPVYPNIYIAMLKFGSLFLLIGLIALFLFKKK